MDVPSPSLRQRLVPGLQSLAGTPRITGEQETPPHAASTFFRFTSDRTAASYRNTRQLDHYVAHTIPITHAAPLS
jgi:hypothetical protein